MGFELLGLVFVVSNTKRKWEWDLYFHLIGTGISNNWDCRDFEKNLAGKWDQDLTPPPTPLQGPLSNLFLVIICHSKVKPEDKQDPKSGASLLYKGATNVSAT